MNPKHYSSPSDGYMITVGHVFAVLRARWRSIAITLAVALLGALVLALVLPKRYTATAAVLLDIKSPDPINGQMLQGLMSPSYMNTQIDLITSEQVSRRVVQELRLNESADMRALWMKATDGEGNAESWMAEKLVRDLVVAPSKDSNVLRMTYVAGSAANAANVVNAFVKAYIDTTLQLRVEPAKQYKRFFDENAKQSRLELEAAQRQLSDFEKKSGLIGNESQVDIETTRLNELSTQYLTLQAQASDTRSRRLQSGTNADQAEEALNSSLISGLRGDLQRDRTKLRELRTTLGENHPQIKQLRDSIDELNSRVAEETRRVTGGIATSDEVNKRRLADLKASVDAQREKVLRVKSLREDSVALRRDVENAQKAYDAVMARANQMNLESQAAQTNVSVVGLASPPTVPSSPKLGRIIMIGLLLGTLGGLLVAFVREMRDQRIRTDEELTALLHQPLIVTMPRFGGHKTALIERVGTPAAQRAKRLTAA